MYSGTEVALLYFDFYRSPTTVYYIPEFRIETRLLELELDEQLR